MIRKRSIHFLAVEKITFLYILITLGILFFLWFRSYPVVPLFLARLYICLAIIVLAYLNSIFDRKIIRFLRYALTGGLLIYWYPETFDFNRYLPNCDYLLANWEQTLFGCQPAYLFSKIFHQNWFSELMNMGYFLYYALIVITCLYFYFKNSKYFKKYFFTLIFSFFVFYLIYILFPTSGPQYYFMAIKEQDINAGIFPFIGDYFNIHSSPTLISNNSGFFNQMVKLTQKIGERPTAAFPSSHVGITTLIMILAYRERQYVMTGIILPFYIILVLSTVYVQAHFVVDVFGGLVMAVILYKLSYRVYDLMVKRDEKTTEYAKARI
jgi:membrane-associated phospholipid phosphatase